MNITKNTLCLSAAILMSFTFVPDASADGNMHGGHQMMGNQMMENHDNQMQGMMNNKAAMGKAVVNSVSTLNRKINVTHEAIPALNWPKMTMDIDVADGVDLESLNSGDEIAFHIELGEDKVYRITKIMSLEDMQKCKSGMDCPMHENMMEHGQGNDESNNNDSGHGNHEHH